MQLSALRPLQPCPRPLVHSRARGVVTAAAAYREGFHQRQPLPPSAGGWLAAAAAVALLLAAHPVEAKGLIQGSPRVVDGDTLDFSGTRVRLFGIDAPETKQSCTAAKGGEYPCGEKAKQALMNKIGKAPVVCEQARLLPDSVRLAEKNRDKYGRVVGICSANKEDLNAWMVQEGLAVAYRQYSKAYVPLEEAARAAGKGIWSGTFEVPQMWRQDNPRGGSGKAAAMAVAAAAAPMGAPAPAPAPMPTAPQPAAVGAGGAAPSQAGCAIKGNITAKGDKIYHVPGGTYYASTKIELDKGERFFCSEAEAQAAGWRASRS